MIEEQVLEVVEPVIEQIVETVAPIVEKVEAPKPTKRSDFKVKAKVEENKVTVEPNIIQPEVVEKVEAPKEVSKDLDFGLGKEEKKEEVKTDWREYLKSAPKEELLKELGIDPDDDFEKEFKKYRRGGGDPYKYLEAKTKDWGKVDDKTLALNNLATVYPTLSKEELDILFEDKYNQLEYLNDDEKNIGSIRLKADAFKLRAEKIEEQKKFSIPEISSSNPDEIIKQYQSIVEKSNQEQADNIRNEVLNHPSTKALMDSKKVAIPAGEFGVFNIKVDPNEVIGYFNDANVYNKYSFNEKGEPDLERKQKLAVIDIVGIEKYNQALINYGKQQAQRAIIEEGQNAIKPTAAPPSTEKKPIVWRST